MNTKSTVRQIRALIPWGVLLVVVALVSWTVLGAFGMVLVTAGVTLLVMLGYSVWLSDLQQDRR